MIGVGITTVLYRYFFAMCVKIPIVGRDGFVSNYCESLILLLFACHL